MIHTMLPIQHLQKAGKSVGEPERRLMMAVLQTVLDDCQGSPYRRAAGRPTNQRARQMALAYVSNTDRTWLFSFENICEAVGLDAIHLRRSFFRTGHSGVPTADAQPA